MPVGEVEGALLLEDAEVEGLVLLDDAVLEGVPLLDGAVPDGEEDEDALPLPLPPGLGRYLTLPEQLEDVKESSGTKVPVCKLPRTL